MTIKLIETAVVQGWSEHETLTRASLKSCDTNREDFTVLTGTAGFNASKTGHQPVPTGSAGMR